ncbi:Gfo/Idh/MocA family oxidoreductase [Isosphaeraceae bacterium EP7]
MRSIGDSRRAFLETMGLAGAGALLGGTSVESARGFAANDTIEVACIGTGGRCQALMKSLATIPNVRIAAVCDIYDKNLDAARKLADPKAAASKDFREILGRKDLDAVLIAAPDHWHVPMTVAACRAGKDVYVEKPLTHSLAEGTAVIAARKETGRVVQVGTQQRSMPHFQKGLEILKSGNLGRVFKVNLSWNRNTSSRFKRDSAGIDPKQVDWKAFLGNAPDQPFDEYRLRNWRWFWDFGGGLLTDLMVHFIDVAHWYLDLEHPVLATAVGEPFLTEGVWQTPDTIQCLLQYPGMIQAHFDGTFSNQRNAARIEFLGTEATLYLDRGRYELIPEPGKTVKAEEWILGSNPRKGQDFYDKPDGELLHLTNWVECVRSRAVPNCPVEAGVSAASAAHLGNLAYRGGGAAHWAGAEAL